MEPSSDTNDAQSNAIKSKTDFKIKGSLESSTEEDESSSEESIESSQSEYSTKDMDVIHQRQKEKRLKRLTLTRAMTNFSVNLDVDDAVSISSEMGASVGTSKISDRSFRAAWNLERMNIPIPPYNVNNNPKLLLFRGEHGHEPKQLKKKNINHRDEKSDFPSDFKALKAISIKWKEKVSAKKEVIEIFFEPTYRLEPIENIRINSIMEKIKKNLDILIRKHENYNREYSPKFAQISSELIKNDVKEFKYDRYKIIVNLILLQKVVSQSCLVTSACLWNEDTDKKICLKFNTKSFHLIAYIFMVYHE